MCDPLSIAGATAALGGAYLNRQEQQKSLEAQVAAGNQAVTDNFARQQPFQEKSQKTFADTLGAFDLAKQNASQQTAETARVAAADKVAGGSNAYAPVGNAPNVVAKEIGRRVNSAVTAGADSAKAAAKLAAPGDLMFGNQVTLGRSAGQLAENSNQAQGIARLLPLEKSAAMNNAKKGSSGIGDFLQMAGMGASIAGGFGYGPSWGDLGGWFTSAPVGAAGMAPGAGVPLPKTGAPMPLFV